MPKDDLFYDLKTFTMPDGADSPSRLEMAGKSLGYEGVCTVVHHDFHSRRLPGAIEGVEVKPANANDMRRLVDRFRPKAKILIVHGGEEAVNRAACEDTRVDVLAHPQDGKGGGINHVIAKLAADHYVAIEFDMYPVIHVKGGGRVRTLAAYRSNLALVKKFGAPYVITSGAMSHLDMRDTKSMISLCAAFGMNEKDSIKGLSEYPRDILKRRGPGYIMEGVEVVQ